MSGLRLCFFTTFYPPFNFGGDGIVVERLARALVARGCEVTVVHDRDAYQALRPAHSADPMPTAPPPALRVIALHSRLGRVSLLLTHQLGRPVVHARRIRRILGENDYDAIAFHNVSLLGGPGLLGFAGDTPAIYMAHEHWLVCPTHTLWRHNRELCTGRQCVRCSLRYRRLPQLWRWSGAVSRHARGVDTFVAMSDFSRRKHREFGFDRPMEVLPCFLPAATSPPDAAADTSPHPRPYFLYVGRLERLKGVDDLLTAFAHYAGADLLVAGDGDHSEDLRRQAAGNPRVVFLGRVEQAPLGRYYRHAIALLVPSRCYETFGVITLEAFGQRTPVIARRLGPLPEIVESAGELFDTEGELLAAMERLQSDPARRRALGEAGFDACQTVYAEQVVVPRFIDLVHQAIDRRRRRGTMPASDGSAT